MALRAINTASEVMPARATYGCEIDGSIPTFSQRLAPAKSQSDPRDIKRNRSWHRDRDVEGLADNWWDRPGLP